MLIKSKDRDIKRLGITYLGLLSDTHPKSILDKLGDLLDSLPREFYYSIAVILLKIGKKKKLLVRDVALKYIYQGDSYVREIMLFVLAQVGGKIDNISEILSTKNNSVRWALAYYLGKLSSRGDKTALKLLIALAEDREPFIRAEVAKSLKEISKRFPRISLATLLRLCDDYEVTVRWEAITSLGRMDIKYADIITQKLNELWDDPNPLIRTAIIRALKKIGTSYPEKIELFIQQAKIDNNCYIKAEVAILCGKLVSKWFKQFFPILEFLSQDKDLTVKRRAIDNLAYINPDDFPKIYPLLSKFALGQEKICKLGALKVLKKFGHKYPKKIFTLIKSLIGDKDPQVKSYLLDIIKVTKLNLKKKYTSLISNGH
jgi:3-methyladenine DNA glycosylase AlkC